MKNQDNFKKLEESYYRITGKDFSEWEKAGIRNVAIPDAIYFYYNTNKKDKVKSIIKSIEKEASKYYNVDKFELIHKNIVSDFIKLFEKEKLGDNKLFISALVAFYLPYFKDEVIGPNRFLPRLPQCDNENEVFVDLISGFSFLKFYKDLKEDTFYYLVDTSLFACEGLRQAKKEFLNLKIEILRKNILNLTKNDFCAPISVLRAKNLFAYVDIRESDIKHFQSLIRPGGKFVFQEDSDMRKKSDRFKSLFKGWKKIEERGDPNNKDDLDTFTYIKPE